MLIYPFKPKCKENISILQEAIPFVCFVNKIIKYVQINLITNSPTFYDGSIIQSKWKSVSRGDYEMWTCRQKSIFINYDMDSFSSIASFNGHIR